MLLTLLVPLLVASAGAWFTYRLGDSRGFSRGYKMGKAASEPLPPGRFEDFTEIPLPFPDSSTGRRARMVWNHERGAYEYVVDPPGGA